MSVKFGSSTYIQNPDRQDELSYQDIHTIGRTASGNVYVYRKGVVLKKYTLTWNELREKEKAALQSFFESVNGPSTTFTFIDHFNVTWTARFLIDILNWKRIADESSSSGTFTVSGSTYPTTTRTNAVWSVTIELEVSTP